MSAAECISLGSRFLYVDDRPESMHRRRACRKFDLPVLFSPITHVVPGSIGKSRCLKDRKFRITTRLMYMEHYSNDNATLSMAYVDPSWASGSDNTLGPGVDSRSEEH